MKSGWLWVQVASFLIVLAAIVAIEVIGLHLAMYVVILTIAVVALLFVVAEALLMRRHSKR